MKKLVIVLVSALAAGLFFGCSNGSDNNNAGLLLAAGSSNGGNSSVNAILPANVGENPFVGKSFENNGEIYKFDANYITLTKKDEVPANSDGNTKAYTIETISIVKYAYNAETKNLYYSQPTPQKMIYKNADGEQYLYNITYNFSSEDELIRSIRSYLENTFKITGETFTEEFFNYYEKKSLSDTRKKIFTITSNLPDGYKDGTLNTPLTPAQMAYYSKYMNYQMQKAAKVITCHAYDFDGANLKLSDEGNFPAGIKFGGIYNGTYNFSATIEKDGVLAGGIEINPAEIIDPDNFLGLTTPSISLGLGTGQYLKITSATDDYVTGILQAATAASDSRKDIEELVFTDIAKITVKLENETTADKTTVTVKFPDENGNYETLGTFEIPYNNSISSYKTYTKCN